MDMDGYGMVRYGTVWVERERGYARKRMGGGRLILEGMKVTDGIIIIIFVLENEYLVVIYIYLVIITNAEF